MIDRQAQRFIKEGLLYIYRERPEAIDYPVYYLPLEEPTSLKAIRDLGSTVRSLHSIPEIPWPDENCIVCTEDHISSMLEHPVNHFIMMLHSDKLKARYNLIPKDDDFGMIEPVEFFVVFCDTQRRNAIRVMPRFITLAHRTVAAKSLDIEESMSRRLREFPNADDLTDVQKNRLRAYWRSYASASMGEFWIAKELGSSDEQMGLASDVLAYLSNIAVPCHYVVKSSFDNGFGTKSMRRRTQDKPIFSVIAYERLYRMLVGGEPEHEMAAHFRRGHIRHHWKKAGLDRFALPTSAIDRMKLVHQRRVERVYIPPTWIGQSTYNIDGVTHEVVTNEIPLVTIRRNPLT